MTRIAATVAAALVATGGYEHLHLYQQGYRYIPNIGVAFLIQAGSSFIIVVALLVPWRGTVAVGPFRPASVTVARLGGLALNVGTLTAFTLSRTSVGVLGFHEQGLNPAPDALITLLAESGAAVLLVGLLIARARVRRRALDDDGAVVEPPSARATA